MSEGSDAVGVDDSSDVDDKLIDSASPEISGELLCGVFGDDGKVHFDYSLSEMTGEEEDILAGKGPVIHRLSKMIYNCLSRLGPYTKDDGRPMWDAVKSMLMPDRMLMLLRIREVTLGRKFKMSITCPDSDCKRVNSTIVDIAMLETKKMPEPGIRKRTSKVAGLTIKWHSMDIEDEDWLSGVKKKHEDDKLTIAMLCRLDEVDGVEVVRDTPRGMKAALKQLKKLSSRKRIGIRKLFTDLEADVDTEITYECPSCHVEIVGELDVSQKDFFFPQEI